MNGRRKCAAVGMIVVAGLVLSQVRAPGGPQNDPPSRFEFQIVESFDAKYLGDTPGHLGRGSIGEVVPDAALGDPVFREDIRVGTVTSLRWDRSKESLEVEFDPEPFEVDSQGRNVRPSRIAVGQTAWISIRKAHQAAGKTP